MSARVDRAIAAAGLAEIVAARIAGELVTDLDRFARLDLLLLGAIADRVRRADRGDVVRIHLARPSTEAPSFDRFDPREGGHAFVRRVALARLHGRGAVRVDLGVGVQLAQVALVFGADEWIAVGRRLPLADDDAVLAERELASLVRSAGRTPRIVIGAVERDVDEAHAAKRTFRAPGRDKPAPVPEGEV